MGIVVNHYDYKDYYSTTSIQWKVKEFFVAQLLRPNLGWGMWLEDQQRGMYRSKVPNEKC